MAVPVEECPGGGAFGGGGDEREELKAKKSEATLPNTYRVLVFDASGRLLLQTNQENIPVNLKEYLRAQIPSAIPGIYFVHATSASDQKAFKIFLD